MPTQDQYARGWFPTFPYAHPDPTLVSIILNNQNPMFADKRVRWALALMLDPVEISMASYRGAATMSAIAIPPTGTHTDDYSRASAGLAHQLRARHGQVGDQAVRSDASARPSQPSCVRSSATPCRPIPS